MPTSYFILNLCIFEIITLSKQINLTVLSRRGWVFKTCALDSWSVLKVCCLHVYFKFSWTDSDCVFRELSPMAVTPVLMSILFIHQGSVSALLDSKLFWHNHIHQLQTPAQWMQGEYGDAVENCRKYLSNKLFMPKVWNCNWALKENLKKILNWYSRRFC